ncbi:MAG: hypothetical protein IMZ69_02580 [Spirochaetes bacterium]|nr:hypothetical protein [Spirochaetota bacterium]
MSAYLRYTVLINRRRVQLLEAMADGASQFLYRVTYTGGARREQVLDFARQVV